jgi:hypothetical protein
MGKKKKKKKKLKGFGPKEWFGHPMAGKKKFKGFGPWGWGWFGHP